MGDATRENGVDPRGPIVYGADMTDPDEYHRIAARMRMGGTLTALGIVVLVGALFGTCVVAAGNTHGDPTMNGMQIGQSPWLLLSLAAAIALIATGQAKKSNARRDQEELYKLQNTTIAIVPDSAVQDGPFRGAMKEVPVLDPYVAEIEASRKEADRRRGTVFMSVGFGIMGITVLGLLAVLSGGEHGTQRAVENFLTAFGLAVFPFGGGLFFAIKGLLLRSK